MEKSKIITVISLLGIALTGYGAFFFVDSGSCSTYYLSVQSETAGYSEAPNTNFKDLSSEQRNAFRKAQDTDDSVAVSGRYFDQPTIVKFQNDSYVAFSMVNDGCRPFLHDIVRSLPVAVGLVLLGFAGSWKYREEF